MNLQDQQRNKVISTVRRDIPKQFWEDARIISKQAYMDIFHQVNADPNVLAEQKIDKLYQDRHFRMENVLATLAKKHDFKYSSTMLVENNRTYLYATKGSIGITQSYVPSIDAMPQAAKFRERHAELNQIPINQRLALGDEPEEVTVGKDFYGILIHNPIGKKFSEEHQKLGALQFCIPSGNFKEWLARFTMDEIIAEYYVAKPEVKTERHPQWKESFKEKKKGIS